MSAIGSFYLIRSEGLPRLEAATSATELFASLERMQTTSMDYGYSGWVLTTLLPILKTDYGIDLMQGEPNIATALSRCSEGTVFLFTLNKRPLAEKLGSASFQPEELQAKYEAFNRTKADGIGQVMIEGIKFLRSGIEQVGPETIGILSVG